MESLDLHQEIERLRSELRDAHNSISQKEEEMVTTEARFVQENERILTELKKQKERYERLLSNHQRLSKLNHELEEKLLQTIENTDNEKKRIAEEIHSMKIRLEEAEHQLVLVTAERNRFKEDCALAVGLLQTNPESFQPQVAQPLSSVFNSRASSGDHAQPNAGHFPTFLPTFPPIGLSSMLPLKPLSSALNPSSDLPQPPLSNDTADHSLPFRKGVGYPRPKNSVITHL